MKYRLLALDLDGTLLGPDGRVSPANAAAVRRAQEAGVRVVPCTGRAWHESRAPLAALEGLDLGVFVSGASINHVPTGELHGDAPLPRDMALDLVRLLEDSPDAVLVFHEVQKAGHHYLVTGRGRLRENTRWWFELTRAIVRHEAEVHEGLMEHALRVGVAGGPGYLREAGERVAKRFGPGVAVHAFEAIQKPDPQESVHILEVFAPGVDKWSGLMRIAQRHGIEAGEVAAIGDEVNDLPMLRSAGCAVAMANAIPAALEQADHVTRANHEDGVAHAIDRLLAGEWGH